MTQMDAIAKVREILSTNTSEPAEEMITMGKTLMEIGKILKGKSIAESKAILIAVESLSAVSRVE